MSNHSHRTKYSYIQFINKFLPPENLPSRKETLSEVGAKITEKALRVMKQHFLELQEKRQKVEE